MTEHISDPLADVIDRLSLTPNYAVKFSPTWAMFTPKDASRLLKQGWKIHVSSCLMEGAEVLEAVAPTIIEYNLSWKVARNSRELLKLLAVPCKLSHVGKFITAYFTSDDVAVEVASMLHEITRGMKGPAVPSDRRYLDSRLIYYRFGAYAPRYDFDDQGLRVPYFLMDSGERRVDTRRPGDFKPPGVTDPFPQLDCPRPGQNEFSRRGIRVLSTLRQSAKGGVYLVATDTEEKMVMKEARFGCSPDFLGRDATDKLNHEYELLCILQPLRVAPRPIDFFHESENAYLLEEYVAGPTLREHVKDADYLGILSSSMAADLCVEVTRIVRTLHGAGIIVRDLTPQNLILSSDGLKIVDLELAARLSDTPFPGGTPGYGTREDHWAHGVDFVTDDHALGAVLFFILTGVDPFWGDGIDARTLLPRAGSAFVRSDSLRSRMEECLELLKAGTMMESPSIDVSDIEDSVDRLVGRARWNEEFLWDHPMCTQYYPGSFYTGASGAAYLLLELWIVTGDRHWLDQGARIIQWCIDRARSTDIHPPAGLYMGLAGVGAVAALYAAGTQSDALLSASIGILGQAITSTRGIDITHGASGVGVAALLAHLATAEEEPLIIARSAVDLLVPTASMSVDDSASLGFAHGLAGVGYFLSAVQACVGDERLDAPINHVARVLTDRAQVGRGASWKRTSADDAVPWTHWCHGAAGVGLFFLSASRTHPEYKPMAGKAAEYIASSNAFGSCCQCHGLSGDADFLLKCLRAGVGDDLEASALESRTQKLLSLAARNEYGELTWPSEGIPAAGPSYMTGALGSYSFLLRRRCAELTHPLAV